jgi:hypothetical protein
MIDTDAAFHGDQLAFLKAAASGRPDTATS